MTRWRWTRIRLALSSCLLISALGACGGDSEKAATESEKKPAPSRSTAAKPAPADPEAEGPCAPPEDDLLGGLPADLRLKPFSGAKSDGALVTLALFSGRKRIGFVSAFPIDKDEEPSFLKGITDAASAGRGRTRTGRFGGIKVRRVDRPGRTFYFGRRGCRILQVAAGRPTSAKRAAKRLITG